MRAVPPGKLGPQYQRSTARPEGGVWSWHFSEVNGSRNWAIKCLQRVTVCYVGFPAHSRVEDTMCKGCTAIYFSNTPKGLLMAENAERRKIFTLDQQPLKDKSQQQEILMPNRKWGSPSKNQKKVWFWKALTQFHPHLQYQWLKAGRQRVERRCFNPNVGGIRINAAYIRIKASDNHTPLSPVLKQNLNPETEKCGSKAVSVDPDRKKGLTSFLFQYATFIS